MLNNIQDVLIRRARLIQAFGYQQTTHLFNDEAKVAKLKSEGI
jgi:hypothetical protein